MRAMCGRYAFFSPAEAVKRIFRVENVPRLEPRYNVAPTQDVPVVRAGKEGGREFVMLHWGLVPFWAKERAIGNRMINARVESVAEKPPFREAFKKRRCLVLTDGWYEWQLAVDGKQPWFIRRTDAQPFAFAGLWESWSDREIGTQLESCTIVTGIAAEAIHDIHPRMPIPLADAAWDEWLDTSRANPEKLLALLRSGPDETFEAWPVSRAVNAPRNQGPQLIERIDPHITNM
jgi:putative SOS response-associated peptidase YedK